MPKELKEILGKLLEDDELLKTLDKTIKNQKKFDCEIHIKKRNIGLECKASGSSTGMLIALKTVLDNMQKEQGISDDELKLLMTHVFKTDDMEGN